MSADEIHSKFFSLDTETTRSKSHHGRTGGNMSFEFAENQAFMYLVPANRERSPYNCEYI